MDRKRPLWECHLIEGVGERRFAFYIKAHHAFVDGISAMRLAQDCLSTDPAERDKPPIWAQPTRRSRGGGRANCGDTTCLGSGDFAGFDIAASLNHLISET